MKIVVIGGGASGMMAAISASENSHDVVLLEKNEKLGKKIYITGKGRCNITNNCSCFDFLTNVVNNSKFLYSSIFTFSPENTMQFFEENNCNLKTERGNRVFPVSDKSSDIIKAMSNRLKQQSVKVFLETEVVSINKTGDIFTVKCNNANFECDAVIVCTGGISYSATGSNGFGYTVAKHFNHSVINPIPALCPIKLKDNFISEIEGLSLKNVTLSATCNNKVIKSLFGEMIFTKDGISGPIALSLSSYINRLSGIKLHLDFKPALDNEKLNQRLLREFDENKNVSIFNILRNLLPKNFVSIFLKRCQIDERTKANSITTQLRNKIVCNLKHFDLNFDKLYNIEYAIITSGGVDVKNINPKTMESKLVKNLFFAGEVLDVDALTGGYNLQIALATGYVAGKGAN